MVQLSTLYTNPERYNAHCHRLTDEQNNCKDRVDRLVGYKQVVVVIVVGLFSSSMDSMTL